ncbi:MAG: DUF5053 domain-containing protein, partial [Chitinophagaceae bacterium]|nr:DUF5053 domain-containing protein [Chitinophagaceae bacterium]
MKKKIEALLKLGDTPAFYKAFEKLNASLKTKKQQDEFDAAYREALAERGAELNEIGTELNLRLHLKKISEAVSMSYIAKKYFQKSKEWLYQRINGYIVNGKKSKFTPDELYQLQFALKDISKM